MPSEFGPSALSGIKILVVEDDQDVCEMHLALLELCGATVASASSGNTGWRAFQTSRPDLVISDIQMPDGDGYELVRRIRALSAEDGGLTPAIAVSATHGPEDSLAAGFHAHLVKPVDPLGLVDVVRSFLREGGGTRSTWVLSSAEPGLALLTFVGYPTADDMRASNVALVTILEARPCQVVVDLRQITGFDLSVGSIAERTVWNVRRRILGGTIVGGPFLGKLVAKATCMALGISCTLVERWPPEGPPAEVLDAPATAADADHV